ncbi:hypothetical protein F5B21DRAFT_85377 [Xylaria acuta]|nr:hypothetical protein F5B21DRAFT_85377 [Xylaria acuta]
MFQLPSQVIVAIVQLIITTLQLLLMIFTWFNPKRTRPFIDQRLEAAETVLAPQHGCETPPTAIAGPAIQLTPSCQRPPSIHDITSHSRPPSVRGSRA